MFFSFNLCQLYFRLLASKGWRLGAAAAFLHYLSRVRGKPLVVGRPLSLSAKCQLSNYVRFDQFSILSPSKFLKCFTLSVTKIKSLAIAVAPIMRSNSSCMGIPIFLNRTFSFA